MTISGMYISPQGRGDSYADSIAYFNGYKYWLTHEAFTALGSPGWVEISFEAWDAILDGTDNIIVDGVMIKGRPALSSTVPANNLTTILLIGTAVFIILMFSRKG